MDIKIAVAIFVVTSVVVTILLCNLSDKIENTIKGRYNNEDNNND